MVHAELSQIGEFVAIFPGHAVGPVQIPKASDAAAPTARIALETSSSASARSQSKPHVDRSFRIEGALKGKASGLSAAQANKMLALCKSGGVNRAIAYIVAIGAIYRLYASPTTILILKLKDTAPRWVRYGCAWL